MMVILYISIALLVLYISNLNFRKIHLSLKLPGPFPLPFLGNALYFINKKPAEIWAVSEKLHRDFGDDFTFWLGSEFGCILSNPKSIEVLLTSSKFIEKSSTYQYLRPWLNDGLLISTGAKWLHRRKLLTPAFHFNILEKFVEIFNRQSTVFVDILSKYKKTDKVELFPLISMCTLDIIGESSMGVELNAQQNRNIEYVQAVHAINHVILLRAFDFLLRQNFIFRFSKLYQKQQRALKVLHTFTDNVIRERRVKLIAQENVGTDNSDESKQVSKTFLDILLQENIDGKPLSNLDIREEVDTFMFEGHETTSSALLFCFHSIAKHPEIQQKVIQEIRDVLGDDCTKAVTYAELNNLKYLELVLKETLRLYPSVPLFGRVLNEELTIGNYTYPKGTTIAVSPALCRFNPKTFSNPHEFKPERFLEKTVPFSYVPFSAGPRNCIGQRFAILEIKTLVTKVLRHFEISLADDSPATPTLMGQLITTPEETINFHLKPIK